LTSVATTTLVIAGFLVLVSLVQPVAERLRLPYAVVLAGVGVAVGALASFLLYTPLIDVFNDVVRPIVELPFNASIFLDVFLPILLFHAALMIDAREVVEDAAPILVLAIVAVFAAAAAIGFSLNLAAGVPLIVALLLGSIVATTDPAAVVAILREVGSPPRLTRLLEGESLLNDAAAIVLFTVLVEMLASGGEPNVIAGIEHFLLAFFGGIVLGAIGGRIYGAIVPFLGGARMAEVTLAVALPYIVYLLGEEFEVSGVVAVASAGLVAGTVARVRLSPDNWRYLEQVWEQMGFWASSLIFVTASALVPRLLGGIRPKDSWLLLIAVAAALASRAAVLFGLFPLLAALHLSQKVSAPYKLAITWGGLRGAVTLALALSVTENTAIHDQAMKDLVAVLATGFVLFTLLVNGLTLRPVIHLLKLDRLSPLDQALRDKVQALALSDVRDAVRESAKEYAITPSAASAATERYSRTIAEVTAKSDLERTVSDRDRMTIGLVAATNQERRIVLGHHTQHTVSGAAIERLRRNTNRLLDGAKTDGEEGYNRAALDLLRFPRSFRFASFLHRTLRIDGPLQRQISIRFETLLVRRLVLSELTRFTGSQLHALLGSDVCETLGKVIALRSEATTRALDALRLQYPEYAEGLERQFLEQSGLRLLVERYDSLYQEGLIGRELFDDLEREHPAGRLLAVERPPLDLGLNPETLIRNFEMFTSLADRELKALARHFRPRLLLPDETVIRKGERGHEMFLISSGAVEVVLPNTRIRLGSGEFFGEMALLGERRRQADVIALGYCRVLVLSRAELNCFLHDFPNAKAEIDRVAGRRRRENAQWAAAGSSSTG
jgi:CPA1 family monovalent cation:H+ antiporter